jgi:RNA polymerase sigma-70 factor (ECF subfamily)
MAFKVLHDNYFRVLWIYAHRLINDKEHAQDIARETFIRLWTKNPKISNTKSLEAYLYKIARNLCINELHRKRKEKLSVQEMAATIPNHQEGDPGFIQAEIYSSIALEIKALPPVCAQVCELVLTGQHSTLQIAQMLNTTASNVSHHKRRAFELLKTALIKKRIFTLALTIIWVLQTLVLLYELKKVPVLHFIFFK